VATGTWTNCRGGTPENQEVKAGVHLCWEFDGDDDSGAFSVRSETALICFDPDITTEGVATGAVMPRRCHRGSKPTSNPQNQCFATLDSSMTGITGSAGTQDACQRVGFGTYYIDVTTSPAGDDAVFSIVGE
jgi:hypothetical protein